MSLDVYSEAERIVAGLSDEQCDAVLAALERRVDRYELEHPRTATDIIGAIHGKPPIPARRRPGLMESIRGVECCDPATRSAWAVWKVCFYVIAGIFLAALVAGALFGSLGISAVVATVCIMSMLGSHRILGGKASVCH
jgi:hypothetical protein